MAGDDNIQSKATDFVKKILTVGMGTLFLTEESLKNMVSEFKLPKELLGGILESANKTRKEFLHNLSQDLMSRVSEKMDVRALVDEVLQRNSIDIRMSISFRSKEEQKRPDVEPERESESEG